MTFKVIGVDNKIKRIIEITVRWFCGRGDY